MDFKSLSGVDKNWVKLIKKAYRGKPDFAGHYYLVDLPTTKGWAHNFAIIDCLTGLWVESAPYVYTQYDPNANPEGNDLRYLPNSRLLIMDGFVSSSMYANLYRTEFYELKDGKLVLIKSLPPDVVKP